MPNANLDLGPCAVYYGTAAAEVSVGETQGGVRISFAEDVADLMSDQWGTQAQDQVISGQGAEVVVPMADYTLANLATALSQSVLTLGADSGISGERNVGSKKATPSAGKSLLLKKYVDGAISADTQNWIRFPVAAPTGSFEIAFDGSTQRIIETTFKAFPDANDRLYFIGDETAAIGGS